MKAGDDKVDAAYRTRPARRSTAGRSSSLFGDSCLLQRRLARSGPPAPSGGIYGNDAVEATYPLTRTSTATGQHARRQRSTTMRSRFPPASFLRSPPSGR
jgi:hypothetical protein